jgi:hypothetical protein
MQLGPIVRRELVISVRRESAFRERTLVAGLVTAVIVGVVGAWDYAGWDRFSIAGASQWGLTVFGAVIAVQTIFAVGVISTVALAIARERDRKTLDAVLTSRLSSAEIVLETLAAGLSRTAMLILAPLPILVLVVFLGGIDPLLVLLALAGVAATALAVGTLAVAISAGARTAQRSVSFTVLIIVAWIDLPFMTFMLLMSRPVIGRWVRPVAFWLIESSPISVVLNLLGVVRRTSLAGGVLRMIGLELGAAAVLLLWAIWRLRPASRALGDFVGRTALHRLLGQGPGRRKRPACGDDPVLWNEKHSTRGATAADLLLLRLFAVIGIVLLVYVTSWFALPAFAEVFAYGYGAWSGASGTPEMNPFARAIVNRVSNFALSLSPGQARLDFNVALRLSTAVFVMMYALILAGFGAESMAGEKERDTWLGLIATPLTGPEIIRAKILGSLWRLRGLALTLAGLWTLGLLAGAVHPLGFLTALAGLGVTSGFYVALGTYRSLWAPDRKRATEGTIGPVMLLLMTGLLPVVLPSRLTSAWLGALSPPFLAWASLFSYDDLQAAARSGAFPPLAALGVDSSEGFGTVGATVLFGLTAQALAALFLTRAACRGFDAAAGRPIRPGRRCKAPRSLDPY